MALPYRKIFKQAYEISRNNKFLWIFGLFLFLNNIQGFIAGDQSDNIWFFGIELFLIIFLVIVALRSHAAIIIAVKSLIDKQQTSFKIAWISSKLFYLRLLYVQLLLFLSLVVLGSVLWFPVRHFINQHQLTQAWILGSFGGVIFLTVLVVMLLLVELAPMFVVIYDQKVQESFDKSFDLIKQFLPQLLVFGLMVLLLHLLPVVLLRLLTYYNHGSIIEIVGSGIASAVSIIVYIFTQTAWVLLFNELVKPQKLEAEEPLPVAEIG